MLKIRLQGTANDIRWFLKILKRDTRFITNDPSDLLDIKGTEKYKRVFAEIFRDKDEYTKAVESEQRKEQIKEQEEKRWHYSTGVVFEKTR